LPVFYWFRCRRHRRNIIITSTALVTFITNIIGALLRRRTTWRTRRLSETKPARSAKRPARAMSVPAFGFKKSALVRLSGALKTVCGVPMGGVIKIRLLRHRHLFFAPVLLRFALDRWRLWILDLDPIA